LFALVCEDRCIFLLHSPVKSYANGIIDEGALAILKFLRFPASGVKTKYVVFVLKEIWNSLIDNPRFSGVRTKAINAAQTLVNFESSGKYSQASTARLDFRDALAHLVELLEPTISGTYRYVS
jgi:hypothetical protein